MLSRKTQSFFFLRLGTIAHIINHYYLLLHVGAQFGIPTTSIDHPIYFASYCSSTSILTLIWNLVSQLYHFNFVFLDICIPLIKLTRGCVKHPPNYIPKAKVGPVGFEPTTSSARGWHPAKLDNGP